MDYIPLEKCKNRYLYKINSRNLDLRVFNKDALGFIGIREKLGSEFLFTEYHCDSGFEIDFGFIDGIKKKGSLGTVFPLKELERIPDEFYLKTYLETRDRKTQRIVEFDEPQGWYFIDTKKYSEDISPYAVSNKELFNWLREKEKYSV